MPKIYLRKRQLKQRYGETTGRTIERAVKDGRIPPPEYPFGENIPMWDLEAIEENERLAALRRKSRRLDAHEKSDAA